MPIASKSDHILFSAHAIILRFCLQYVSLFSALGDAELYTFYSKLQISDSSLSLLKFYLHCQNQLQTANANWNSVFVKLLCVIVTGIHSKSNKCLDFVIQIVHCQLVLQSVKRNRSLSKAMLLCKKQTHRDEHLECSGIFWTISSTNFTYCQVIMTSTGINLLIKLFLK